MMRQSAAMDHALALYDAGASKRFAAKSAGVHLRSLQRCLLKRASRCESQLAAFSPLAENPAGEVMPCLRAG